MHIGRLRQQIGMSEGSCEPRLGLGHNLNHQLHITTYHYISLHHYHYLSGISCCDGPPPHCAELLSPAQQLKDLRLGRKHGPDSWGGTGMPEHTPQMVGLLSVDGIMGMIILICDLIYTLSNYDLVNGDIPQNWKGRTFGSGAYF